MVGRCCAAEPDSKLCGDCCEGGDACQVRLDYKLYGMELILEGLQLR